MYESIIESVVAYFMACPLLKDGVFRTDALGTDAIEYAIQTSSFDPVISKFVDGTSYRQYQFYFTSMEYYDMDRVQEIENSAFYERFAQWIEEQNKAGNLPALPEGMEADEIRVQSPGYVFDIAMQNARYQIPLVLFYYKE